MAPRSSCDSTAAAANPEPEFLTTRAVSEMTGIPMGTWRFWRHTGQGPASFTLGPKRVVYRRSEIARWIAEQESATKRGGCDVA